MLLFSTLQRISPIQRPYYITSSYSYQFFEKKYFVPHYSIALHLSPLEWGCYLINIVAQYLLVLQHKRMYLIHIPYLQVCTKINHFF